MKIFIASDLRAAVCDDRIYLASQHYSIIKRYCDAFGKCILCSRRVPKDNTQVWIDATDIIEKHIKVDSLMQSFTPFFVRKIKTAIYEADLVIARIHSFIGMHALFYAKKKGRKCFAEVMGDAWDGYWNHGFLGKLIAPYAYLMTKYVVWNADYALYVTRSFLQKRYPCKCESVAVSDVEIQEVP